MYVGMDVGKEGAIVELTKHGQIITQHVIPLKEVKSKKRTKKTPDLIIDLDALCELLHTYRGSKVIIEDVHSIFGSAAGSNFGLAESFMALKMGCTCAGLSWSLATPKAWQKAVWIPSDIVTTVNKSGKMVTDTKATRLKAAVRLFDDHDFRFSDDEEKTRRKRVPNDGIVDAALIAYYCMLINETK